MAQNKILPWAQTPAANALSDADYASAIATNGAYADGVKSGQASSKQANKTWRQATAPGSGLGQFLVDNLDVDVTDADTPATFSSRIANAVLKLSQISPFNQSWATAMGGYRKYAIVSDGSGNYWSSTADQNVTIPGMIGAKWQSLFNGYATQAWSSSQFVGRGASIYDYTPLQLGVNKASGQVWTSYTDDSGNLKYAFSQPAGDYATNTALNSETTRATQAESNIQSSKVNRSGDTMRGALSTYNDPNLTNGAWNYSPAFRSYTNTRSGFRLIAQDKVGDAGTAGGALVLDWNGTDKQFWWFNPDGTITQSTKGTVLFAQEASALYATFDYARGSVGSSGDDWFWMKLPNGWIIQGGNAKYYAADGIAGTTVKLPTSFGSQFVIANGNDIGANANAVTVMRIDSSTIRLLGREVTGGTLQNTTINYLCVGTAP